jgi:type IV pilus assembly protein PilY1
MDMKKQLRIVGIASAFALAVSLPLGSARSDDTALFSTSVPPNVMLIVDNSGSMNTMVWHPDYIDGTTYSCNTTNGGFTTDQTWMTGSKTFTKCGKTRTFWADPKVGAAGNNTIWDHNYMNWIFSLANTDPRLTDINATANGTYSACLQARGYTTFDKYRRARVTAAKDVVQEVICNVNQSVKVRFGMAEFRLSGSSNDPNGGYVRIPINDYDAPPYTLPITSTTNFTGTHQQQIDKAVSVLEGETWTPLGETLFTIYTYFMSRTAANRPKGLNGATFPGYVYKTNPWNNYGDYTTTTSQIPADPVQYDCQKNFVIIITDGEPTKDDFKTANTADNTAQGYSTFTGLIGNYNNDGETEIQGADCVNPPGDGCALYLDDIAKFMEEKDFRPDRPGVQKIDTYTVGFTTSPQANDLLSRTAAVGKGLFYHSSSPEDLTAAIVNAVSDIVQKSQSFTAATVPATRTSDGGNIYTSLFLPQNDNPFWEGHLKLFHITADGDILDKNGNCALLNPSPPGQCKAGAISDAAVPYWDAADQVPDPAARTLYTTVNNTFETFDTTNMNVLQLGDTTTTTDDLTMADVPSYPAATPSATSAEVLADQIVQNVRGCTFGTGVGNTCVRRPWLLGDIFHANPLVVGEPRGFIAEASYSAFANAHATRQKAIYGGANDGFLHSFDGGTWQSAPPTGSPGYDVGTGKELFGFMPWPARQNIKQLPKDHGTRDYYYVDGSPVAADVWWGSSATQTTKAASGNEWRTLLAGGLRQGGGSYYALDVTDPNNGSYPSYLWEFPKENAASTLKQYFGQTWGTPILTRIKVQIAGVPYERWVAIVTGGYSPSGDPNDTLNYSATATAGRSIYVVDLQTGQVLGQKMFQPLLITDLQSSMKYAIASTPAVYDLDGDGFADVIYVGDTGGNIWKWVIAYDPANGNYGVDPINSTGSVSQPNWKFKLFFKATQTPTSLLSVILGTNTYYKSFFYPPAATFYNGTLWLSFATGERNNLKKLGDTTTDAENNRFYSVMDLDPLERTGTSTTLAENTLYDATNNGTCASMAGFNGYFFKARDGEKFITDIDIFAYQVIAASYMPVDPTNPCSTGGTGTLYTFRVNCGEGYFGGTTGDSRRLDMGAGMPTDPRVTVSPSGTRVITTQQDGEIENSSGPPIDPDKISQLYWREIFD